MGKPIDVAVIGAGPYGLSLAAHLSARGVSHRIFGRPLETWRHHMPKGMLLKSEGFASNLSAPERGATLKAYAVARGLAYADRHRPIALETFLDYADWFRAAFVPHLEAQHVKALFRSDDNFTLMLESGECLAARHVVLATGIAGLAHVPCALKGLPKALLSHSYDHRDLSIFRGKDVTVIGAGASAIDTAALLDRAGAGVKIVARASKVAYHTPPDAAERTLIGQLKRPTTALGPGWRSFFCANTPLIFHRMPEALRLRATENHLGPAPGWFMRDQVEDRILALLGQKIVGGRAHQGRVVLDVVGPSGTGRTITSDHVIAATGYRPDLRQLSFLTPLLRATIAQVQETPILSEDFETSVKGLYVIGPAAANAFGPLMRFMVGAEFAAPRVANHLRRRLGAVRRAKTQISTTNAALPACVEATTRNS